MAGNLIFPGNAGGSSPGGWPSSPTVLVRSVIGGTPGEDEVVAGNLIYFGAGMSAWQAVAKVDLLLVNASPTETPDGLGGIPYLGLFR